MAKSFSRMSVKELKAARAEIDRLISTKEVEERDSLKAKVAAMVEANGFSISELFNGKTNGKANGRATGKGSRGKVAPKYRNPANAAETWSGRGRQPLWLVAALKKGGKAEKFLIK